MLLLLLYTRWPHADMELHLNTRPLVNTHPLDPEYQIHEDRSATLRICYNSSCARTQTMTFSADELSGVVHQMAVCAGATQYERLQRLRIAIWQLELLAQRYQPALANDMPVNSEEFGVEGRTDCVDNATNTTTFLNMLADLGELPGWTVSSPQVRMRLDFNRAHWTAVMIDQATEESWSIDSWYQKHGHLPFVLPLDDWMRERLAWESPFDQLNPYPLESYELCEKATMSDAR